MARPNNLWLRVWLLLAWCIVSTLNSLWILPTLQSHGVIDRSSWVESIIYTVVVTAILAVIWFKLKHPDCTCWDDIDQDPSEEAAVAKLSKTHTGQTRVVYGEPAVKNMDCPDEKPYPTNVRYGIDKQGNTTFI